MNQESCVHCGEMWFDSEGSNSMEAITAKQLCEDPEEAYYIYLNHTSTSSPEGVGVDGEEPPANETAPGDATAGSTAVTNPSASSAGGEDEFDRKGWQVVVLGIAAWVLLLLFVALAAKCYFVRKRSKALLKIDAVNYSSKDSKTAGKHDVILITEDVTGVTDPPTMTTDNDLSQY